MINYHQVLLVVLIISGYYAPAHHASTPPVFSFAQAKAIARHTSAIQEHYVPFETNEFAIGILEPVLLDIVYGLIDGAAKKSFDFRFNLETCYPYLPTLLSRHNPFTGTAVFHILMYANWDDEHFAVFWNLFLKSWRIAHSSQKSRKLAERHAASKADACKLMHLLGIKNKVKKTVLTVLDVFIINFKDNNTVKESFNWILQELVSGYRFCFPTQPLPCSDAHVRWLKSEAGISFDFDDDGSDSSDSSSAKDAAA